MNDLCYFIWYGGIKNDMSLRSVIIVFLLYSEISLFAQSPEADFDFPDPVCKQQQIVFENQSSNATQYEWDFCLGDFLAVPVVNNLTSITAPRHTGFQMIRYGNEWIAFALSRTTSTLFRIEFGNSLSNTPVVFSLGSLSGALDDPEAIIIRQNSDGNWIGFIGHFDADYGITRLNFGLDLKSIPATENIGTLASGRTRGLEIIDQEGHYYLLASAYNINRFQVLDLGSSLSNSFIAADIHDYNFSTDLNLPTGIDAFKYQGDWLVFINSFGNGKIARFNFGSSLVTAPALEQVYTLSQPAAFKLRFYQEGDNYYAMSGQDFDDQIMLFDFGDLSVGGIVSPIANTDLPTSYAFDLIDSASVKHLYSISSSILQRLDFENDCNTSHNYSEQVNPENSFSTSGTYDISLSALNVSGEIDQRIKSITISTSTAPDISISQEYQISCVGNPINFEGVSSADDIQFYDWDFGDGTTVTDNTVPTETHTYSATGTYEIILDVTDADPCDNFMTSAIKIFEQPVSSFDVPAGVICSNDLITFINTVPDNFENNETFEWQVDGVTVSTQRDLEYTFASGGSFDVKLITGIPGCTDELIQTVNIIEGPDPDFVVSDGCVGTLFEFNNQTTGDNITSYEWNFDNGFISVDENPEPFEYDSPGSYEVTLTVTNASGCETNITKLLTVYDLPSVDFTNDLACEQTPTQFIDESSVNNANIVSWQWDFDDPQSGDNYSAEQNPTHEFSNFGEFDVKLITTTTFGCIDSIEQVVNVNRAPVADFSFSNLCIGEEVQFTDQSSAVPGEQITSWAWNLGGEFSSEANPSVVFDFPIDYDVSLTVTSQNLCTNTLDSTITIYPIPNVGFDFEDACDNQITRFFDTTQVVGDPIVEYSWEFENIGTLNDSAVSVDYGQPGDYTVMHGVETERGCFYSTEKTVTIYQAPIASFDVSSTFGSPPFEVNFNNQTTDIVSQTWDFDDDTNSSEESPTHIFEEEGTYSVSLAVEDANGCRDTTSLVINALIPNLEVELQQVTFVNNKLILTIINNGTLVIDSLKAVVSLDDRVLLEENISRKLIPAANPTALNHTLSLNISNRSISYICVTLESYFKDIEDSNLVNNSKCKNFVSPVTVVAPYPNPAQDVLNVDIITERVGKGNIKLTNSMGQVVFVQEFNAVRGKNELDIDVSSIKGGMYLLEVNMAGANHTSRVAIN